MIDGDRVVHEVRYAHPVQAVWRALTDPRELAAWLMPNDFAPETGHRFRRDARPEFGIIAGEVIDVQPPQLLRCRWTVQGIPSTVTIRLEPDGADPATLRAHARDRGWDRLRLLSCADNTFKYDLGSDDADGGQESTVSVFALGADGSPQHSYTAHPSMSDAINQRGIDLLAPVWNLLDLTPGGRGDWYAGLGYAP